MLTEDYVSFEISKLLKEKGFTCDEISCIKVFKGHTYKIQDTVIDADEDVQFQQSKWWWSGWEKYITYSSLFIQDWVLLTIIG